MTIYRVAKLYEQKIRVNASSQFIDELQKIMQHASALSAGYDIYDAPYDRAIQLAALSHRVWQMSKKPHGVIPASVFALHLDRMRSMAADLGKTVQDSGGRSKLQTVVNLLNSTAPVDVGTATEAPASSGAGNAMKQAPVGADPDKLRQVVEKLSPKTPQVPDYFGEQFQKEIAPPGADPSKLRQVVDKLSPKPTAVPDYFGEDWDKK